MTLLVPYIAWVIAGRSMHLPCWLVWQAGSRSASISAARWRRRHVAARAVWELVIFILNGVIFILIGLQLGALRDAVPAGQYGSVLLAGLMVSARRSCDFWVPWRPYPSMAERPLRT